MTKDQEIQIFLKFLKTLGPDESLNDRFHGIFCTIHAFKYIKAGQPANTFEDGKEYGPRAVDCFIEVDGKKYTLNTLVMDVIKDVKKTHKFSRIKNAINEFTRNFRSKR